MAKSLKQLREDIATKKQYPKFAAYMNGQNEFLDGDHDAGLKDQLAKVKSPAAHKAWRDAETAITQHHKWSEKKAFDAGHSVAQDYEEYEGHIPSTLEASDHHPALVKAMKHHDKHILGEVDPTQYGKHAPKDPDDDYGG